MPLEGGDLFEPTTVRADEDSGVLGLLGPPRRFLTRGQLAASGNAYGVEFPVRYLASAFFVLWTQLAGLRGSINFRHL